MNKLYYILVVLICTAGFAQTDIYTSFNSGELSPDLHGRIDARKFYSGCRILENFFVWAQGPVEKRPGTYFVGEVGGEVLPAIPEGEAIPPTYSLTYFSEHLRIWGIPVGDGDMIAGLDNGGAARDVGGGIVGLPYAGHPFAVGDVIRITGTTNYDGQHTLGAGTTANELQITDTYGAEIFDGTEVVVEYISLTNSSGRMTQDSSKNMYYGISTATGENFVITIEADGTIVTDFFVPDGGWPATGTVMGMKVSNDDNYLYVFLAGILYKFNISDGTEVWNVNTGGGTAYDIDIDVADNVYIGNKQNNNLCKFDASDGTKTEFDLMGEKDLASVLGDLNYAVTVDDGMNIVLAGGRQYCVLAYDESLLYNLTVRDLDNTEGSRIQLGGTYTTPGVGDYTYIIGTSNIVTHNEYIFVLCYTPTSMLYKLDKDLNIITSVAGPDDAVGLYVDLWSNIVVVNQDGSKDDILWFYDENLSYLSKTENMYTSMLVWWAGFAGSWIQGNVVFDGHLGTPGTPAVLAVIELADSVVGPPPARLLSFEYSEEDSYVIEAGTGYFRFYVDE